MNARPLFDWLDVLFEYIGFLASFGMLGAIGFRYGVLRSSLAAPSRASDSALQEPLGDAAAGAAGIGLLGVVLGVVSLIEGLLKRAESKHQTVGDAFSAGGATSLAQVVLLVALLVAFVLAWRRISIGWPIAAAAGIAFALRNLLAGKLAGMVNPLHVLGASLWIGTLFVLVVCGLGQMLRPAVSPAVREQAVAEMVHRFSVVGLGGSGLLAITGAITAWTHLNPFAALWTTPYGYALIAKLCVVAVVVGLGAWNWRHVGPSLGMEGGAMKIRRSATTELVFAALVLLLTAILVSLPSPKLSAASSCSSTRMSYALDGGSSARSTVLTRSASTCTCALWCARPSARACTFQSPGGNPESANCPFADVVASDLSHLPSNDIVAMTRAPATGRPDSFALTTPPAPPSFGSTNLYV